MSGRNKADLVTTRIVSLTDNKEIRLDPRSGTCLIKIFSDAFTQGYFTFSDQGHMSVSDIASDNLEVNKTLNKYKNRKIYISKECSPNKKY